ncbi:Probable protease SohB [Durusdinium trenchii]|uniref:Probable protease SohB n=1 Tax=Durusdinium trenchii TaxID=1381693 RepID=A0ABP0QH36_9DINO
MFPCFGVSKSQALKRLGGEPGDVLEERRLKVVRLNDEVTAFQAALAEQAIGPAVGQELRDRQRRKRFTFLWQQVLNDIVMSDSERNKVEEAVLKYLKEEQQRQREFRPARSEWLSSNLRSSWFGSMFNGYVVTSSLQKKVRLQEELIANIRKALPDVKKFANLQKVLANVDISWLTDLDVDDAHSAQSQSAQTPKTVYVLSFDGDPTAAGASLLQQEVTAILQSTVQPEEVVLKLKSSGGTVTGYGLAAAQLLRFQQHNIRLVVCVDELAASGGYMMASCAQRVLCSPFAAVGSIGVTPV